jgi:hypothetical protein
MQRESKQVMVAVVGSCMSEGDATELLVSLTGRLWAVQ